MAYQPTLPPPTWHGFDRNMVTKYMEFLKANDSMASDIKRREEDIEYFKDRIQECSTTIRNMRDTAREAAQELEQLKTRHEVSDEELGLALERLVELPFVIGTRIDAKGLLIVQIRVMRDANDGLVFDYGDYEVIVGLHLSTYYSETKNPMPVATRLRKGPSRDPYSYDMLRASIEDVYHNHTGYLDMKEEDNKSTLLIEGSVDKYIQNIHNAICMRGDDSRPQPIPPAASWNGYWPNPVTALRASIKSEEECNSRVRILTDKIKQCETRATDYVRAIADYKRMLRDVKASLKELQAQQAQRRDPDPEKAERTLRYIMTLPGVMGIKFNDAGVPVIHVRASHVQDGRRYDFGDYEFTLSPSNITGEGVLVAKKSRGRHGFWDHFDDGRFDGGWFCFGSRATELNGMYRQANYADMMHLLINSINGVNNGYEYHLTERYDEIPVDLVWQTVDRPLRTHRDRHARIQTAMGRAAVRENGFAA